MTALVIGLVLFLGLHSTRMVADGARSRFIAQRGARAWRGVVFARLGDSAWC
mgnify:CR=1 FL=1